jgi:glutathione S-transferase
LSTKMEITPTKKLLVRDWKENVVNIVQYPRAACIPNMSPYSLKVETFVRWNKLQYQNVNNEFKNGSVKGLVPFIELNGRHYPDSNNIMEVLIREFSLTCDSNLSEKDKSDARAYTFLLEQSFFPALMYLRGVDPKWMFNAEYGALGNMTGVKKVFAQSFAPILLKRRINQRLINHGYGRNSQDEIEEILRRDLKALSTLLGDKPFFFGPTPSSFDSTAFAHLAQFYACPQPNDVVLKFSELNTPNLKAFFERVKAEVWSDWEELGRTLAMNPEPTPIPELPVVIEEESSTPINGTNAELKPTS